MNPLKWFWEGLTNPMPKDSNLDDMGFSPRAQQVLALARDEAGRLHHNFVGTEHLLLGIIKLGQGVAFNVLTRMGVDLDTLRPEVERAVGTGFEEDYKGAIPYTPRTRKVLSLAAREANHLKHTHVGTEHILLGLLREGDGVAARVLRGVNVSIDATRKEVLKELDPNAQISDFPEPGPEEPPPQQHYH